MNRNSIFVLSVTAVLLVGPTSSRAGQTHEIDGATSFTELRLRSGTDMLFQLSAGYHYLVAPNIQFTLAPYFGVQGSTASLRILVGPTLNFPMEKDRLDSAFYLSPRLGFAYAKVSNASETALAYAVEAGKRISLTESLTWKPSVQIRGTSATGSDPTVFITPVQFSLFL